MRDDRARNQYEGGSPSVQAPGQPLDPLAALFSYLIPGLGQVYQGRIAKGLLFFVCIYTLFFYGLYQGSGSVNLNGKTYTISSNVYLPDSGDQNNSLGLPPGILADLYNRPQFLGQFWIGIAAWPALWQYHTYDKHQPEGDKLLGTFERTPSQETLNALNTSRGKLIDLGWVYTVIAGVLNIMVIYDALAGPAFPAREKEEQRKPLEAAA
jgi:hypothetical protein